MSFARACRRGVRREAATYHDWREIAANLPQEPITRKIEQRVERAIRAERSAERKAAARKPEISI